MSEKKLGCLLMNIGTPDEPTIPSIRKFLKEFLSDPDVIDYNPIIRWLTVNFIVAPFRPKSIIHQYQSIWTDEGSPLLINSTLFANKLSPILPSIQFEIGMRYGNPSIAGAINKFKKQGIKKIILIPMFPQYAKATCGSCIDEAKRILKSEIPDAEFIVITNFYSEDFYINSMYESISDSEIYKNSEYLLFSFHGIPERQIRKMDDSGSYCLEKNDCCETMNEYNQMCYKAHCIQTVSKIIEKLNPNIPYSICFQSRFGIDKWVQPNIVDVIEDLSKKGIKKVSVSCPSFVADCLETLEEVSIRNNKVFTEELNGEYLKLIPSLNDNDDWIVGFSKYIKSQVSV
tara:strand:- start:4345 stop:5376 length:1032 start_codon:yes stop_codon:yes gene_type:complete